MVGASFRIEIDDASAKQALAGLLEKAQDLTPAMDEIGAMLVTSTLRRFETGQAPGGAPWPPSARAIRDGGQTLVDSGRLRDSITHYPSRDQVVVGSNVVYAAIHQLGGRAGRGGAAKIPARPYLGVDAGDKAEVVNILSDYLGSLN